MNIRYPIYEGVYRILTLNLPVLIQGNSKSVPLIYTPGLNQTDF